MNNEKFKKGIENLKSLKLTEEEKNLMLNRISLRIDENLRIPKVPSPYFNTFSVFAKRSATITFAFLVLFGMLGGITVAAAEKSLPGDLLYKIKVNITEPVVSAVTLTKSEKVNWEAEKANRRLKEAEALIKNGTLDKKSKEEIEARFIEHTKKMNELSKEIVEKYSKLDLEKNTEINKDIENKDSETKNDLNTETNLESELDFKEGDNKKTENRKVEKVKKIREDFEKKISKHAENLEKMKEKLSDDTKTNIDSLQGIILENVETAKRERNKDDEYRLERKKIDKIKNESNADIELKSD